MKKGFTLVELLVVIGILALLAAILMPAMNAVMRRNERMTASMEAKSVATGWKGYFNEYGRWLFVSNNTVAFGQDARENISGGIPMNAEALRVLTFYNPREITFLDLDQKNLNSQGTLTDPWGNPIKVLFDVNSDGHVTMTGDSNIYDNVIVWSMGPDGLDQTAEQREDDLRSWE